MEKLSDSTHQSYLEWSTRFRSESLTLADFLNQGKSRLAQSSTLEKDFLALSPFGQLQGIFSQMRRNGPEGSPLNLKFSLPTSEMTDPAKFSEWEKGFDLILRMMAENDVDYQRLKGQFSQMFDITREHFSEENGEDAGMVAASVSSRVVTSSGEFSMTSRAGESGKGGQIELQFNFQRTEKRFDMKLTDTKGLALKGQVLQKVDPLILDLNGDGFNLTDAKTGASFDIDGDGSIDRTAWVKGDDALLYLDRNNNGRPDNGKELFGDQNGAPNGFTELAKHDENRDGIINKNDSVFRALRLYRDLNGDKRIQSNESVSLEQAGITAINLEFFRDGRIINGNNLLLRGTFSTTDGKTNTIADFLLGFHSLK